MNLVFGSLLLFILTAPGLLFRFSYLQGSYGKLTFKVSAVEEFFWALIPAFFLQLIAVLIVENVFEVNVRLDLIYQLITSDKAADFSVIESSLFPFLIYSLMLILISVSLGTGTRYLVRKYRLDHKFRFFRFGNEWHYLFSGEIFQNREVDPESIFFIQVDVVMNSSQGDIIYSGILEDFYLSKDNGLDRIYLRNVYRRHLKDDLDGDQENLGYLYRLEDERYYAMPGDLFVIRYDKIINMNVSYITLENGASSEGDE